MSVKQFILGGLMAALLASEGLGQTGYQRPPKAVTDILDAPAPMQVMPAPGGWQNDFALFVRMERYPGIEEVAAPMLRLAGVRLNPKTNGKHLGGRLAELQVGSLSRGKPTPIMLPEGGKVGLPEWSPDGKWFAAPVTFADRVELWVGSPVQMRFEAVPGVRLNGVLADPIRWLHGERGYQLLCLTVPANRGVAPAPPAVPAGPVVQESDGKPGPVRTYQDLLQNAHDEALFAYYATAQLTMINITQKVVTPIGEPGLITDIAPAPGSKLLLVSLLKKPFSYLHTYSSFPSTTVVWDLAGKVVFTVVDRPLQDKIPIEGVPTGPRAVRWLPAPPATLMWVEAQDDGDPRKKVPHRDVLLLKEIGKDEAPVRLLQLEHRYSGADFYYWGQAYQMLVRDYDRERKWTRTFRTGTNPQQERAPKLLFERSSQDRYNDPGTPLSQTNLHGQRVLRIDGPHGRLIMNGAGASPKGDRPFLDLFSPETGKAERVFECREGEYADVIAVQQQGTALKMLIRRESPTEPPNYFLRDGDAEKQLTTNTDPAPELRAAKKQLVTTKRADGTIISFTLHTPPNYKDGEKLPAVFYAYPTEFATADTAGQVTGSPYRFTSVTGYSHLFFLTQGYAVVEVSMPIVGPPAVANDTFVEQLVANAKAAIDKAAEMGVIDPNRLGVMGHSYGAFMTANLLAHCDLFRAGIARSGAYNRTLTPFGFQNERRTFWEAPTVYGKMSPFYHADKINEPILLIHGEADNNPGTFPIQSERLYAAIKGNGGKARLVLLPHESHGYLGRESVEHVLAEQIAWFDKYVKNAGPRK